MPFKLGYKECIAGALGLIAGQLLIATIEVHGDLKAINLAIYYLASVSERCNK
jgi:hypothetical protein